MKIVRDTQFYDHADKPAVVTIGNFDGLHIGHQKMIGLAKQKADELGAKLAVYTFDPLPAEYFSPSGAPERLMSATEKCIGLSALGVDVVCLKRFDEAFSKTSAESFASHILKQQLNACHVVVGDDFRYGTGREGSLKTLIEAGNRLGFSVTQMQTLLNQQQRVSSTRLRALLLKGAFDEVNVLLGKPYNIVGRVIRGDQRGRTWGFPTLNLSMQHRRALHGVYAVQVKGVSDETIQGVANIGVRPTVGGLQHLLEVHLFDFAQEVYGQRICVDFCTMIRSEQKFDSFEALQKQIMADCDTARKYFQQLTT